MNLSGAKALSFCKKPQKNIRIALIHGADEGVAADAAQTLIESWRKQEGGQLEVHRLLEDEIRRDRAMLQDALAARSLLGEATCLRVNISNDYLSGQIDALFEDMAKDRLHPENYLVVLAGQLTKKSKIRKSFESSSQAVTLQLYADDERQIADLARDALATHDVTIEDDALTLFTSELPGDRRLANAEIEKLSLYAVDLGRPVNVDDIGSIAATEQPKGADDASDAALAGNYRAANIAIDRFLEAGGSPISAMRTLHFRLMRVVSALAGEKYLRPPIFDKEKPAFNAMLKDWSPARVSRALTLLYRAELTCKQAGAPSEAILKTVIDRISRRSV